MGSSNDPCYIQNRVVTNRVIKRSRCTCINLYFVAQCLYTVSEDNPDLAATSLKDSIKQTIAAPATPSDTSSELVLLRTLSMGILVNLEGSKVSAEMGELVAMVTSLAEVLGIDVVAMLFQNNSQVHVGVCRTSL